MALFLPQRWRRQPQYPVRIDRNNPLTIGLGVLLTTAYGARLNNVSPTADTSVTGFGRSEKGLKYTGTTSSTFAWQVGVNPDAITIAALFDLSALANFNQLCAYEQSATANIAYDLRLGSTATDTKTYFGRTSASGQRFFRGTANAFANESFSNTLVISSPNGLIESAPTYYANKTLITLGDDLGAAGQQNSRSVDSLYIGTRQDGASHFWGTIYQFVVWSRQLSAAESLEWAANPWQLFAPLPTRRYFIGAAGPVIVVGTAKASAGGNAKAVGTGAGLGTAKASAGGNAKAVGTAATIGIAKASGGGEASAVGTAGAVSKTGTGSATGGGAARAVGAKAFSGIAAAQGGGNAKAVGGVPPPPGLVDHYIHGWPVNKDGALLVRIMP